MDPLLLITSILIVLPYPFYAWAYKCPRSFGKFCSQKNMIRLSVLDKWISLGLMLPATYHAGGNAAGVIIGVPFIFLGQYLNELVYCLLGDKGVYYGLEFRTIKPKKISGFPFTLHDPQYKGSFFTVLGWFLVFNVTRETCVLYAAWVLAYFGEMIVENTTSGYFLEETAK